MDVWVNFHMCIYIYLYQLDYIVFIHLYASCTASIHTQFHPYFSTAGPDCGPHNLLLTLTFDTSPRLFSVDRNYQKIISRGTDHCNYRRLFPSEPLATPPPSHSRRDLQLKKSLYQSTDYNNIHNEDLSGCYLFMPNSTYCRGTSKQ